MHFYKVEIYSLIKHYLKYNTMFIVECNVGNLLYRCELNSTAI